MPDAAEVLAEELELRWGTTETWAEHILDALKTAGYAVVELPKRCAVPSGWDEGCTGAWPCDVNGVADPISTWPEPGREIATSDGDFCSIAEARAFAVALLAAADAAEATE